jgi:signal peptidase I
MTWLLIAAGFAAGAVSVLLIRRRSILITVQGHSMSPTYFDGDRLVVKRQRTCEVGDVVVFRLAEPMPGMPELLVKRVVAVAGDEIPSGSMPPTGDLAVPPNRFIVLGDNARSLDSRRLGYIATEAMLGVVVRRLTKVR